MQKPFQILSPLVAPADLPVVAGRGLTRSLPKGSLYQDRRPGGTPQDRSLRGRSTSARPRAFTAPGSACARAGSRRLSRRPCAAPRWDRMPRGHCAPPRRPRGDGLSQLLPRPRLGHSPASWYALPRRNSAETVTVPRSGKISPCTGDDA
jgi:hypothetical protein